MQFVPAKVGYVMCALLKLNFSTKYSISEALTSKRLNKGMHSIHPSSALGHTKHKMCRQSKAKWQCVNVCVNASKCVCFLAACLLQSAARKQS